MRTLVQKFGGTSLSDARARSHAIGHIKRALADSYQLVVVVSAMGRKGEPYATDSLLELIRLNGNCLPAREKDLLLHCGELISAAVLCSLLEAENISTVVLTGAQAGIRTNERYGDARIESIQPSRVVQALSEGKVVIVPGFQGETAHGDITTLGRGGSDTTATALGASLRAERVDIFTDVSGVFTADPKIVDKARPIERVTYAEICNLAYQGAKVIHPRAVEIAMEAGVPIRVRSTFSDDLGTLVTNAGAAERSDGKLNDRFVTGIAHVAPITQIKVAAQEGQYDLSLNVFKAMAEHRISVDFINANISGVSYTVFDHESERAIAVLTNMGYRPEFVTGCAKVSIIGGGMNGVPGIMASIVEALTKRDIPILQSADSNATIWVLVKEADMTLAIQALHHSFSLDK
ncbi:aspartate kinase [Paenibacillus sp. GYB003]|uniref:aspartate kinase n=1 Tax=Paenibacillus sp. GYB003 TaxID=2994392 RepID=UPI002F96DA5A